MNSFNVDRAVECIKTIAEKCRCVSCDELKGLRVRYPCGHSVCENCVITAEDCSLCLVPPDVSTHVNDAPLSLRVQHASNLLHSFQELFKLDVYRRQRVSEQLQLEKQLFPDCIQALAKYSNSRRCSNISIQNKENIKCTRFPGENTSTPNILKMENKMSYVQQWLNKNETSFRESNYNLPRKPFTDINVNGQNVTRSRTLNKVTKKEKAPSRNKIYLKSLNSDFKRKKKLSLTRLRKDVRIKNEVEDSNFKQIKCDKNESGIVIEDEIVIINESQNLDKDKAAWLAVIEADKSSPCDDTNIKFSNNEIEKVVNTNPIDRPIQSKNIKAKVPFYKKSSLLQYVNNQSNESKNKNDIIKNTSITNNVTITIDNSTFVTTIKFFEEQNMITKNSIGVQTHGRNLETNLNNFSKIVELKVPATENSNSNENYDINITSGESKSNDQESANLFEEITPMEASQKHLIHSVKEPKCLIIDDSDSDSVIWPTTKDSLVEVTAEVHRSKSESDSVIWPTLKDSLLDVSAGVHRTESGIDHTILSQLEQEEYEHRFKHAVRGHTPASTDSSDKENYDPNRAKRQKIDKKHCCKKY